MSFKCKYIKIIDWAGNELFLGDYEDKEVDKVLDANRCKECESGTIYYTPNPLKDAFEADCPHCEGTGYKGDFSVQWYDESDKKDCNVYEYINY